MSPGATPRRVTCASPDDPIAAIVAKLDLPPVSGVIVVNGSTAAGAGDDERLAELFAALLERVQPDTVLLTGGTDAGVFRVLGAQVAAAGFTGPVVGVAPTGKIDLTGEDPDDRHRDIERHHTHVVAVDGDRFGDETPVMVGLTAQLASEVPLVVLVVGGGDTTRREVGPSLEAGRSVVAIAGTGRLADELATRHDPPPNLHAVTLDAPAEAAGTIASMLTGDLLDR